MHAELFLVFLAFVFAIAVAFSNNRIKFFFLASELICLLFYSFISIQNRKDTNTLFVKDPRSREFIQNENVAGDWYVAAKNQDPPLRLSLAPDNPIKVLLVQDHSTSFVKIKLLGGQDDSEIIYCWEEMHKSGILNLQRKQAIKKHIPLCVFYNQIDKENIQTFLAIPIKDEPDTILVAIINAYVDDENIASICKNYNTLFSNEKIIFLIKVMINR